MLFIELPLANVLATDTYCCTVTSVVGEDIINGLVPFISTVYLFVPAVVWTLSSAVVLVVSATSVPGVPPSVLFLYT